MLPSTTSFSIRSRRRTSKTTTTKTKTLTFATMTLSAVFLFLSTIALLVQADDSTCLDPQVYTLKYWKQQGQCLNSKTGNVEYLASARFYACFGTPLANSNDVASIASLYESTYNEFSTSSTSCANPDLATLGVCQNNGPQKQVVFVRNEDGKGKSINQNEDEEKEEQIANLVVPPSPAPTTSPTPPPSSINSDGSGSRTGGANQNAAGGTSAGGGSAGPAFAGTVFRIVSYCYAVDMITYDGCANTGGANYNYRIFPAANNADLFCDMYGHCNRRRRAKSVEADSRSLWPSYNNGGGGGGGLPRNNAPLQGNPQNDRNNNGGGTTTEETLIVDNSGEPHCIVYKDTAMPPQPDVFIDTLDKQFQQAGLPPLVALCPDAACAESDLNLYPTAILENGLQLPDGTPTPSPGDNVEDRDVSFSYRPLQQRLRPAPPRHNSNNNGGSKVNRNNSKATPPPNKKPYQGMIINRWKKQHHFQNRNNNVRRQLR